MIIKNKILVNLDFKSKKTSEYNDFSGKLISWYIISKRDLPWRHSSNPYYIWLSEVILQQTRIIQGLPYYINFVKKFPDIKSLALASEKEVLRTWQGLGYYTRARNLHKCAKMIHFEMSGKFPDNFNDLLNLPGVGKYTAAAIASIAFGEPVPVVDGNVTRVLARYFGIYEDITLNRSITKFSSMAAELMSNSDPGIFNQALMEFGALICTPKNPACDKCIFSGPCYANSIGFQSILPKKSKKITVRHRYFYYLVITNDDKVIMNWRQDNDIWKHLYDFPMLESSVDLRPEEVVLVKAPEIYKNKNVNLVFESEKYKHVLTHQRIIARFDKYQVSEKVIMDIASSNNNYSCFELKEVLDLPKPRLIDKYLTDIIT